MARYWTQLWKYANSTSFMSATHNICCPCDCMSGSDECNDGGIIQSSHVFTALNTSFATSLSLQKMLRFPWCCPKQKDDDTTGHFVKMSRYSMVLFIKGSAAKCQSRVSIQDLLSTATLAFAPHSASHRSMRLAILDHDAPQRSLLQATSALPDLDQTSATRKRSSLGNASGLFSGSQTKAQ